MSDSQINEKGVRDYLNAARILADHENSPAGPRILCQGQAVEIALKLFLQRRGVENPGHHKLLDLHGDCVNVPDRPLTLTTDQVRVIAGLHPHHHRDGDLKQASRYRPDRMRVLLTPGQAAVDALGETILAQANATK